MGAPGRRPRHARGRPCRRGNARRIAAGRTSDGADRPRRGVAGGVNRSTTVWDRRYCADHIESPELAALSDHVRTFPGECQRANRDTVRARGRTRPISSTAGKCRSRQVAHPAARGTTGISAYGSAARTLFKSLLGRPGFRLGAKDRSWRSGEVLVPPTLSKPATASKEGSHNHAV